MFSAFQTFGRLGAGGLPFSERALWPQSASSPGLWIDPSYTASEFQNSAGTTALSTVGTVLDSSNPVGLVLDRKGGLVLGSELIVNGDFGIGTGWTASGSWVISGSVASNAGAATNENLSQAVPVVSGKTYQVTYTISAVTGSGVNVFCGGSYAGTKSSAGTYTARLACSTPNVFDIICISGSTCTVDNISVREIPGLHLSQSTSAARPVASGRKNLLVGTDALATQSVTVIAAQCVLSFTGTGTVTLSGVSTAGPLIGTGAADRVSLTFTPTAGSLTLTVSGSVTFAQLEYRA